MGGSGWRAVDLEAEIDWLGGEGAQGSACGFDPDGWESNVWILNSMYELPGLDVGYTHDDAFRAERSAGIAEPDPLDELGLSAEAVVMGGGLGYVEAPPGEWQRLRWVELANRLGTPLGHPAVPPCFRWFAYRSWPASIMPPTEGSLDEVNLASLLTVLGRFTDALEIVAVYGLVATAVLSDVDRAFRGDLNSLPSLVDPTAHRAGTPSNFWPEDRSWFVYTDWDLWATKVSGSKQLIEELRGAQGLETLDWKPSAPE